MKKTLVFMIILYQKFLSTILKNILGVSVFCKFSPTCSEYARLSIKKYGPIKGGHMSIKRLARCQPFSSQKT